MNVYRRINKAKYLFDFLVQGEGRAAYDDEIEKLGGTIYHLPIRRNGILTFNKSCRKFFFEHQNYDSIHYHTSCLSTLSILANAKRVGIKKIIIHSHNTKCPPGVRHLLINEFYKRKICNLATDFLSCSAAAGTFLFKKVAKEKIRIIPNAIDTERFAFDPYIRNKIRKDLGIPNKFVIGNVSNFSYAKNHKFILQIFSKIIDRIPNAKLMLVGDGPLRDQIEKEVNRLRISDHVLLMGIQKNIHELLQSMDIYIMPSLFEGLPVSAIEAQAAGLRCFFSSNVTTEVDLTKENMFISLTKDADEWSMLISKNVKSINRLDLNERVKNSGFNIDIQTEEFEKIYSC